MITLTINGQQKSFNGHPEIPLLWMFGESSAAAGRIQQSNFNDFRVGRMSDAPAQANMHIVGTHAPPSGIGELGTPPVIPAMVNAIFAAMGRRVRNLSLSKTKLV